MARRVLTVGLLIGWRLGCTRCVCSTYLKGPQVLDGVSLRGGDSREGENALTVCASSACHKGLSAVHAGG